MKKDFITATPDSGGSGSTTVTVAASANQTESTRSTSLSVAGGGMTRTVGASQAAGVVTWNYYFSVTPTSLSFVAGGETKSVTVTSYRKKVINGVETSTQENVNWKPTVSGTGFSVSGSNVTAAANSATTTRSGTATYTQTGSGKTQAVSLSQAVEIPLCTITYKIRGTFDDMYFVFDSARTPAGSTKTYQILFGGNPGGTKYEDSWRANTGYKVNSVLKAGGRVYVQPGQRVWIRKLSSISGGWNDSTTQSFILEANDQTVNVT
jgi:hypothetical protein